MPLAMSLGTGRPARANAALLWTPGAKAPKVLDDIGGEHFDYAQAINKHTDIVGFSDHPVTGNGNQTEAVLWNSAGKATVLATPTGTISSYAVCISDGGIIGGVVSNGTVDVIEQLGVVRVLLDELVGVVD